MGMREIETMGSEQKQEADTPLFFPSNVLALGAPLRWLRLGWNDMRRAPLPSLTYGVGLVLFFGTVSWLVSDGGNVLALFILAVAFILAGPVLAFGLYSASRQLERGEVPRVGACWRESRNHLRNELLFALVILVVLLLWARAASMVHIFLPISDDMQLSDWLLFFVVGSLVGSVFAGLVFCVSVVSLPLMLDRNTDAVTAALTSVNAVFRNRLVMTFWAALIVVLVGVGLATALLGLTVVLPVVGHATWHAYRETVETER